MRAVAFAVLVLLAGCAARATPPAAPAQDSGFEAVAYRVEGNATDLHREGLFGWYPCGLSVDGPSSSVCDLAPTVLGSRAWEVDARDPGAVLWRVNATLAWLDGFPGDMALKLVAYHDGTCEPQPGNWPTEEGAGCQSRREVARVEGAGPLTLRGDYFLGPDEHTGGVVASAVVLLGASGAGPTQHARLSGTLLPMHPVSGPIPLNVTQG